MNGFLFRLKVSLYLIWLNCGAYPDIRVRRFVWRWLRNELRDLWGREPERLLLLLGPGLRLSWYDVA